MGTFDEEVQAELEKRKASKSLISDSNLAGESPVAETPAVAEPPKYDFDSEVNAELEKRKVAREQPQEPKEPDYVSKFREYGPSKDDEDVKTSMELLSAEERKDLLKTHPWSYTKMTPKQQEEQFQLSRKSHPISAGEIVDGLGSILGTGVDLVKKAGELGYDAANVNVFAPIKQAIENKSYFEVKGQNEIVQKAQEKLDQDARNLASSVPAGIINSTRTIQKIFGGKDLNAISNPIQRAVATASPVIGQQLGIPVGVTQNIVGVPMPEQYGQKLNPWSYVPNTGILPFDLVTKLAESTYSKDAGSFAALDRLNELLGLSDEEQSRNHDHIRRLYDAEVGAEDWTASAGDKKLSPWSQVAFSDIGQQAILFREKSMLPSAKFISDHDGISLEDAETKREKIAEQNAEKATIELTKQWNKEYDPSMEFLGSLFIGDAGFGEAGMALGAGKLAVPIFQKARTLGMTDREASAYYDAIQKLEKAKDIARQKKMSQPSWWGKSAGAVEQKQTDLTAAGQSLFEKLPAPVQAAAPIAGKVLAKVGLGGVAGGVGALLDPENPTAGLLGGLSLTTALGVAPSVIRSVDAARRAIGAGEGKLFTQVAKSPESSLPARIIFNKATGPVIDYLSENGITLAKAGVNLGALSAVTSTLNSDDPEEFNRAVAEGFGMGMGFHLAHGVAGKFHGKDPAQELKQRKKRDVEIYEAVKTASPATQAVLEEVTNYQTAIDRVDALVAKSEKNLAEATAKKDTKLIEQATTALKNARALQGEVLRANVQTRNEYGRSFLSTYADMNRLANGARRAGQPNISLEILTPEQIVDLHVSENSRQGMTPEEIMSVRAQGESYAQERGFFDRAKSRAVINTSHIVARTTLFGESPSDALRHEGSHALDEIPEFQKLNEKTDKLLFTNEEKDLQGNVLKKTDGIYDDNALVEMYTKNYLGDRPSQEKIRFSQQLGLWDANTQSLNIPAVVKYMKSEVRAELTAGTLRAGLGKLMGAEASVANWIGMRQRQNFLARAIQSVTGLGAKPFSSELLGIEYTPEVIAANREAIKALAEFNGRFEMNPEGVSGREMSEKEIRTNPVLRKRYGLTGGEFKTELKGVIRDADGKIIGKPVNIINPLAAEGSWSFDANGNRKQTRGYGQVPDEFQGAQIPSGGTLEVYRDFVYEPDGKTPVRTSTKDLAQIEKDRGNMIRQALTDAIYDDSTTRLAPFSADGLSWSGIMSKSQIQAIKDIPESILPLAIKEKIFAFNDAMARGDGNTFDIDYAPRTGRGKAYKGRKSDIYHIIPIGFGFSKAGNFYLRTLSLNAAFRKLKARAKLMRGWLEPWDNDPNLFMKEFQETYLNNTYEKRDGWLGLDPEHPTEKTPLAEVKFGRFLDFMNMIGADTPPNPQRSATPADPSARKSKKSKLGAEEDNQGIDNLWRSHRLDAIVDIADTTEQTGRYRMDLDRVYKALMPAEIPAEQPAPREEERRPPAIDLGITAARTNDNLQFSARYVAPVAEGETAKPLPVSLYETGTSLESFGSNSLKEIAEHYGLPVSEKTTRGEIIDLVEGSSFMPSKNRQPTTSTQVGYDDTYLKKALKDGKDGKVKLTRPFRADEALPTMSQLPVIGEQFDRNTFKYNKPAEVIFYDHDGTPVSFKWDGQMLVQPEFKDIAEEHAGKAVQLAMADRQTATGGDMGGVMHTFLKSLRTITIKDPLTGNDLIVVWANNEWKPAKNMKDKVRMFNAKDLLVYLMGEDAHASNTRSVRRISNEIDNSGLNDKEIDTFLILANKGVKTARAAEHNKTITDALSDIEKAKTNLKKEKSSEKKAELQKLIKFSEKIISYAKAKLPLYKITPEEKDFSAVIKNFKSSYTRFKSGNGSEANFRKQEKEYYDFLKTSTFSKLRKEITGKHMIKLDDTFKGRKAAVENLRGLTINGFNIDHILPETADFRNGRINHIVSSVELSTNPDLGAVYLGDDPEQAKFMTPLEAAAAAKIKADPNFVVHEAYAWGMLGPTNGNHFLNTNPRTPEEYFPAFRKLYAATKETAEKAEKITNASESNLVNTMREQKAFALTIPNKSTK